MYTKVQVMTNENSEFEFSTEYLCFHMCKYDRLYTQTNKLVTAC
jgi:hypothetical protein